jgi:hypothetical protein
MGILIFLIITVIVLSFILRNLLNKVEKYEDIVLYQSNYIREVSAIIQQSNEKLNESNLKGSFEADDEVGWFFNNLKEIQQTLDNYNLTNMYDKKQDR